MVESNAPGQEMVTEGSLDMGKMVVVLFQGEGGNVGPYKKHLDRLGLLKKVPTELIEIKGLGKDETEAEIAKIDQII